MKSYVHGSSTLLGETMADISSGSAACGGQVGFPRTCVVSVPVKPGTDDLAMTTYDAMPSSGSFSGAHVLGTGTLATSVTAGVNNQFTIFVSGVINSLGAIPANASLPADGSTHTLGVLINPMDFDNNGITAGANDPYANPIGVTLTETGGSGHVQLVKNGTPTGGTSATLSYSTDTVAIQYDGRGAPGYSVAATLSAGGITPQTLTISPLYVTSTSQFYFGNALAFSQSSQTAQMNISETGAASATAYTATPNASCSGVATASAPSGTPAASSSTVTSGSSDGSCAVAFTDGSSTITVSVTTSVPSVIGPISFASYSLGPVRGQQGWLSNSCANNDYDANVVNTSSYPSAPWPGTPPTKALQVSNAITQTCSNGLGSPPTQKSSGYSTALTDTSTNPPTACGSACQPFFSTEFVVTSSTGAFQPSLQVSISPQWNNQGAPMQYVALWHTLDSSNNQRLLIFTRDVEGVIGGTTPCSGCAKYVSHEIAYVDPALPHKIGMTIQFVEPDADVAKIYVDGSLAGVSQQQFRSWEDAYLFDTTSTPAVNPRVSRAVNDLLIHPGDFDTCLNFADYTGSCNQRTSGPGHTSTTNNGFLFTKITTCAGTAAGCASSIQTSSARRSIGR